ncbi:efflux RND transporter periplasmic adaptor subunit [Dokdonella sp.]|uniref:efflux RND transporter periplasmic adaptor subunit n=1 Tax=Dokdonella sp. TaxID=2291710 RepID=UPI002F42E977
MHAGRTRLFHATAFVVLVLAGAMARAADDIAMTAAQASAIGVRTTRLERPSPSSGVLYPARAIVPRDKDQMISAAVSGRVDQILVEDHAVVAAGQPLLRINSPEFGELQLKLFEATNQARVADSARRREKKLFAEGIIPERRVIEAYAAASTARATELHARAALRLAGASDAVIAKVAAGQVQDHLEIRAPRAGTILSIEVKPGQRVADADPLLHLVELGTLWLDIDLPASLANSWDPKGNLVVAGREARAKPLSVSAQVNGGQTVTLRATVVEGTDSLRPGEFLQVQVPLRLAGESWSLPNAAVVHHDDRDVVFVRNGDGFRATAVTVSAEGTQDVSVTGPLEAGDEVAIEGTIALKAAWLGESGGEDE